MQTVVSDTQVLTTRVARDSSLPVIVKLSNFGSTARTDVLLTYDILTSAGTVVHSESETYAVETSASFSRSLVLPHTVVPGQYVVRVSIAYPDQKTPAVSSFPFSVEQDVGGVFLSDLLLYIGIALATAVVVTVAIGFSSRAVPTVYEDYSHIPHRTRIYYEIVSDVIREMRMYEGDRILVMAARVPGLEINSDTGRVISFTQDPASVVAALVKSFEMQFNKRVNFSLGKGVRGRAEVK